jgi:hypothetical protein
MGKTQTRLIALGLLAVQVVLLAASVSVWWARRNDTLFSNGRWIVGKDTGKYLFYAHDFMFQPLSKSGVDLTSCMGFQEILYRKPDAADRKLTDLQCRASISQGAYLWVEVEKVGQAMLGCRFSRNENYPSGFYRFDGNGELIEKVPFDAGLAGANDQIRLQLKNGRWGASVDDRQLGEITDAGQAGGLFGFRGSGWSRLPVTVRDIRMEFCNPAQSARAWKEQEDFSYTPIWMRCFPIALLFALAVVVLRCWRRSIFQDGTFWLVDEIGFGLILGILLIFQLSPHWNYGSLIPAAIFGGEIITLAGLLLTPPGTAPKRTAPGLAYGLVLAALGWTALSLHGSWLGRTQYASRAQRDNVQLAALIVRPNELRSSPAVNARDIAVSPGNPWFTEGMTYSAQRITADFRMPSNSTLDIVFQQLSFLTRGDPEGEELPLQRRLLRLSTRPDVSTGLSSRSDTAPHPLIPIRGTLRTDSDNHLELETDQAGVRLTLNGEATLIPTIKPIGFGETGFLTYEQPVLLKQVRVEPSAATVARERLLPWAGASLPFVLAIIGWALLRIPVRLEFAAMFPLAFYAVGTLFLNTETLASLGRGRFAWLDLALAATAFSQLSVLASMRGQRRFSPLPANAILLVTFVFIALFAWDVLPKDHPLRVKFAGEAIAPADTDADGQDQPGPWYNSNRKIGAQTYVWKQRFGGKRITADKPAGTVRIFVVGGSQAWGSGAASSAATFSELLQNSLRAKGLAVEIFNAAANGGGIKQALDLYGELLRGFKPGALVADIGLNECSGLLMQRTEERILAHTELQAGYFNELLSECDADGVACVFALEPMCGETPLRPVDVFYDALESTAKKHGVRALKPAALMSEKETDHLVWWDTAHFAPCGQQLMAAFLELDVEQMVKDVRSRR